MMLSLHQIAKYRWITVCFLSVDNVVVTDGMAAAMSADNAGSCGNAGVDDGSLLSPSSNHEMSATALDNDNGQISLSADATQSVASSCQ